MGLSDRGIWSVALHVAVCIGCSCRRLFLGLTSAGLAIVSDRLWSLVVAVAGFVAGRVGTVAVAGFVAGRVGTVAVAVDSDTDVVAFAVVGWVGIVAVGAGFVDSGIGVVASAVAGWDGTVVVGIVVAARKDGEGLLLGAADASDQSVEDIGGRLFAVGAAALRLRDSRCASHRRCMTPLSRGRPRFFAYLLLHLLVRT